VGQTSIAYRRPEAEDSMPTQIAGQRLTLGDLPPTQRQVLVALARPYKHDEFAVPATNQDIADELHLSVDAVKSHLRTLFQRFGIEHLPQNQKRRGWWPRPCRPASSRRATSRDLVGASALASAAGPCRRRGS
jgi:hypothetical protein